MNPETFNVMLKFFEKVQENEEEYKCKFCLKSFVDTEQLEIHSITTHLEKRFICDFCSREYKLECNISKHIDMMHMELDLQHLVKDEPKVFVIEQREEDYEPESESETEDSDYDKYDDEGKRMKKPNPRKYPRQCDHCDYEVPMGKVHYHHYLIMHKDIIDQYPYAVKGKVPCSYCGVLKAAGGPLQAHEARHTGIKVKCTLCEKQFDSDELMKTHRRRVHTAPKYVCDYCTKGYKTRIDFMRHIRTHTGDKPYKCHICGDAFSHSGNRQIHIIGVHQNNRQMPKNKQVIDKQKYKSSKLKKKNKNSKKKDKIKSSKKKHKIKNSKKKDNIKNGKEKDNIKNGKEKDNFKNGKKKDNIKNMKNSKKKENKKQKDRPKKVVTDSDSDDEALSVIKKMFLSNT